MKSPKPPAAPDPAATAAAQTGTNVSTALANAHLQNVNQVTPDGSLTYSTNGSRQFTDPTSGAVYDLPNYTATMSLSPQQQAIKDQNDAAALNLARTANNQSAFLNDYLGRSVDTSGIPGVQYSAGPQGRIATSIPSPGRVQSSLPNAGRVQSSIPSAGRVQSSIAPTRQSITSDLGQGKGIKHGIDPTTGKIQYGFGDAGAIQNKFADAGAITRTYGTDFSQDRQRVEDAMFSRLNPQIEQSRAAEETRLQNQGIRIGSTAWENAMADFNRGVNDQRTSITLAGGQEQSRLVGLEANRAGFENAAQQQNYGQLLGRAQFSNDAQNQNFGQLMARAQFNNAAQGQEFGQNAQQLAAHNAAQAQWFGQAATRAQIGNAAQAQEFGQNAARGQFSNAAQAQRFGQNAQQLSAYNAAQAQEFGQNVASGQFSNAAQAQRFGQNAQQATFGNQAQQQAYTQAMGNATLSNQGRTQAISELFAQRNQPINEITALLGGAQVQSPQFQSTNMPQIPTVDYAGLVNQNYQNRLGVYNQQQANNQSMMGGLFGLGSAAIMASDRRLKKDVVRLGTGALGLPVYAFRYVWGGPVQIGHMAQDVLRALPAAVVRMANGFLGVDYARILREEIA